MMIAVRDNSERWGRRSARRGRPRLAAVALASFLAVVGSSARVNAVTLVDCDTPDDFCVGDPCTTSDVLVVTVNNCALDFGARTLVIKKKIDVPNGGTLSLTAAAIQVDGKIDGKNTQPSAGDASHVALIATGDVTVNKKIDTSGRFSTGTIDIDAGGVVDLRRRLFSRAKGSNATASGGSVTVEADSIHSTRRGKIDVRGKRNVTPGGAVELRGETGVTLAGRIDARGRGAGQVTIESAAGDVLIEEEVRAHGSTTGGNVEVNAAGDLTIGGKKGEIDARGLEGGMISLVAGGTADLKKLGARSKLAMFTGTVAVTAGTVSARRVDVRGTEGGFVELTSTSGDVFAEKINARGSRGDGGTVIVQSAANAFIERDVDVHGFSSGPFTGGEIRFSTVGDLTLGVGSNSDFDASGPTGGVIEGQAGGDLIARGDFAAAVGGCIGLSAGGVLDTSLSTFDVPLSASCP